MEETGLLSAWGEGLTLFDIMFPELAEYERNNNTVYQHTITLVVTSRQANTEGLVDAIRWEVVDSMRGATIDAGYPTVVTKMLLDPNARITNERLKAYHARMKAEGATTSKVRHRLIKGALGYDVEIASRLTNAEFDKVMASLDD